MRKTVLLILVLLCSTGMSSCSKSSSSSGEATTYKVTLSPVRSTWPIVREASGRWELVGEAVFNNTGAENLLLQSVNLKVFESGGTILADRTYDAGKFKDMIVIVNSTSTNKLAPGARGFCHVAALAGSASLPTLARVTVSFTNGKSETSDIPLYEYNTGEQTIWPLTFTNGNWLAWDTGETTYHWGEMAYNPAAGDYVNSQRYALDAEQLDSEYNLSSPSPATKKEDYYGWGQDILSAGSGTVVIVEHDQIDQEISKIWTYADISGINYLGNYVVIRHGPALYSMYVHMMQNSATVSVGAHVTAGQVIGKVGNSGLSGNFGVADGYPHLHFQYMDAEDQAKAQGLPALFWNIKINRFSDAELLGALGTLPDIRTAYELQAGTYSISGGTPLEFELIMAP